MMDHAIKLLEFEFFANFSMSDIEVLSSLAELVSYEKEVKLIELGSAIEHTYFILEGSCRVSVLGKDGYLPIASARKGSFVGESAFFLQEQANARVHTQTNVVALRWEVSKLFDYFNTDLELGIKFYRNLSYMSWRRLNDMNIKLRESFLSISDFD